jgi:RNA polymerase sigma-70 factor (ECF subfamily)
MDWVTTTTILERLRNQDEDAWSTFVRRFRGPVTRFAVSLGVARSDAEDVAQETLVAFAEGYRAGRYDRSRGRLRQWLFGIAHHQVQRQRRRDARPERPAPGGPDTAESFWQEVPDDDVEWTTWDSEWTRHLLEEALGRLREELQPTSLRAFELTVLEEHDPAEAAAILGVSVKVVYNAKHRALKRLRELQEELEAVRAC